MTLLFGGTKITILFFNNTWHLVFVEHSRDKCNTTVSGGRGAIGQYNNKQAHNSKARNFAAKNVNYMLYIQLFKSNIKLDIQNLQTSASKPTCSAISTVILVALETVYAWAISGKQGLRHLSFQICNTICIFTRICFESSSLYL